jgi:hypothetical protein
MVRNGHLRDEQNSLELEKIAALKRWPEFPERKRIRLAKEECYKMMVHLHNTGKDATDVSDRYILLLNEEQRLMREEFAASMLKTASERAAADEREETSPSEFPKFLRKIMD